MSLFLNSNELESRGDSFVWRRVLLSLVFLSILIAYLMPARFIPRSKVMMKEISQTILWFGLLTITPEIQFLNIAWLHFYRMP